MTRQQHPDDIALKHKSNSKTEKEPVEIKQAIALHYDEEACAPIPKVTATGKDETAEQIIALAKEHGIPIHEDADLAVLLSQLELYENIPESLYHVVAEVLAFAYIVSGKTPKGFSENKPSTV
jgi:flagellar biosynthesis protein